MEENKRSRKYFSDFIHQGGGGIVASVVIILIFLLCATWLKSLFFGIVLACILLPLERFFYDNIFAKVCRKNIRIKPGKRRFSRKSAPGETEKKSVQMKIFHSSLASILSLILIFLLITYLACSVLLPKAVHIKTAVTDWSKKSGTVEKVEKYLINRVQKDDGTKAEEGAIVAFRQNLRDLAKENRKTLANFAFSRGKDFFSIIYRFVKGLGFLLFDIILAIFFGFYFLQKLALFEGQKRDRRARTGEWIVNQFYNSPWLPSVSLQTKKQAVRILTHIGGILTRWIRGYFLVIVIETVLYSLLFAIAGVPYALLAGIVAGCSVLLPFIGPVISFCLTMCLCIAFCEANLFMTLLLVAGVYLLINGLLEQFVLYPVLIGGVSGLTTVETIIVVLIGGIVAGIPGMIFAVPAAAVIKYIIPVIYRATNSSGRKKEKE